MFSSKLIDRVPIRFVLGKYSSILPNIDSLIRKSLEHGFDRFFDRFESFSRELHDRSTTSSFSEDQRFQSQAIAMENIWIYVCIFLASNCTNIVIFLCEILLFYRKKILGVSSQSVQRMQKKLSAYLHVIIRSAWLLVFKRNKARIRNYWLFVNLMADSTVRWIKVDYFDFWICSACLFYLIYVLHIVNMGHVNASSFSHFAALKLKRWIPTFRLTL